MQQQPHDSTPPGRNSLDREFSELCQKEQVHQKRVAARAPLSVPAGWTEKRLRRLFNHYNQRFWGGRLPSYSVRLVSDKSISWVGECKRADRCISINHTFQSPAEIRSTLLHEMCHAAASRLGHGHEFWEQVESLLHQHAPFRLSRADGHYAEWVDNVVPRHCRLARKLWRVRVVEACKREYEKHVKRVKASGHKLEIQVITSADILQDFREVASQMSWSRARCAVGIRNGLTDDNGRALTPYGRRVLKQARGVFDYERREFLRTEQFHKFLESNQGKTIPLDQVPARIRAWVRALAKSHKR